MTPATSTFRQFASTSSSRAFARYATIGARCALGFVFFSAGLIGLLNLMPPPSEPMPEGAMAFGAAMMGTGYLAWTYRAAYRALLTPRFTS